MGNWASRFRHWSWFASADQADTNALHEDGEQDDGYFSAESEDSGAANLTTTLDGSDKSDDWTIGEQPSRASSRAAHASSNVDPIRHRALLVGINYANSSNRLRGCINDATQLTEFVCSHLINGSCADQRGRCKVRVLCDVPNECTFSTQFNDLLALHKSWLNVDVMRSAKPTRHEMERQLRWLAEGADARSHLWFSYSGHGHWVRDRDGDESDGRDEVLVPLDFKSDGFVSDDWLRANVVDPLPAGAQLTCLIDACHSGTSFDLRVALSDRSRRRQANDTSKRYKRDEWIARRKRKENARVAASAADVLMISGCRDNQTSADAWEAGAFTGALTHSFLLHAARCNTAYELLQDMSVWLRLKSYEQRPVMSFGNESAEQTNAKRLQLF